MSNTFNYILLVKLPGLMNEANMLMDYCPNEQMNERTNEQTTKQNPETKKTKANVDNWLLSMQYRITNDH